jgi:abhydrolase domain-containing protein 17
MTQIKILPFDKFDNLAKITKIHCPVLIIHGTSDAIVPFWQGKKLFAKASQPKYFYEVTGAGHNDLVNVAGEHFWQNINFFATKM